MSTSDYPDTRAWWAKPKYAIPATLVFLFGVIFFITFLAGMSWATPNPQQILVIRNGGPFDNHNIRQVVKPGSGRTWAGLFSEVHSYPDSTIQRYYRITSDPKRSDSQGVDVVNVPTQDGVNVGLEGTFYLTTAFDGSDQGIQTVKKFDDQFGTRTFQVIGTNSTAHPWQGDSGWAAFLDAVIRPVIDNELRIAVGGFKCAELVASCALAQSTANVNLATAGQQNNSNIQQIQDKINTGLADDLRATLKGDYFKNIQFRLAKVTLPDTVQAAINDVQAQRVEISKSQAAVQKARQDALANRIRAQAYADCPACAQIDQLKSLPPNSTVYFGVNAVTAPVATR